MSIWTVVDRIFGIVVPICVLIMCLTGCAFLLSQYLSSSRESDPTPIRLQIVPAPRTEQAPPTWRWAGAPRGRWTPARGLPLGAAEVKKMRGESAGRPALGAATQPGGISCESARSGKAGTHGDISRRLRRRVEDEAGLILGA